MSDTARDPETHRFDEQPHSFEVTALAILDDADELDEDTIVTAHRIADAYDQAVALERAAIRAVREALYDAAREVIRFYGTDRTWSLAYRALLGSRIDALDKALALLADREQVTE
jgi:hypothetical protein